MPPTLQALSRAILCINECSSCHSPLPIGSWLTRQTQCHRYHSKGKGNCTPFTISPNVVQRGENQQAVDDLISSLPLVRYLRSVAAEDSASDSPTYKESRPYQIMHPDAISTHLVSGSLLGPNKMPVDPYFFVQTHPVCRLIAVCYIGTHLCGHPGYIHGGLPFLLFDDVFARCASIVFDSGVGMTVNMGINFRKPSIPDRMYVYRAEIVEMGGRKVWMAGQMRCLNSFSVDEMIRRPVAESDGLSKEEEEGVLVAEARALFVEPRFEKSMVPLYPK